MVQSVVILIGPAWRQWAERSVGGLTLLGRALVALGDAGARTIVLVGGEKTLTARALAGRRTKAAICELGEWASGEDLKETLSADPDDLTLIIEQPFVFDKDTACMLMRASAPATLGDASGLLIAPVSSLERKLSIESAALQVEGIERLTPPHSALGRPLEDPKDLPRIEAALLGTTKKPIAVDGVVAYYAMRPFSRRITRALWGTKITPNQVTLFSMFLGLCAAPLAAYGGYVCHLLGALLLFLGATVDCVDGEIARLKHMGSRTGEWLDTLSDDISTTGYLVGLSVGVPWLPFGLNPTSFGLLATGLFVVSSVYIYYVLARYIGVIDTTRFPYFFLAEPGKPKGTEKTLGWRLGSMITYTLKRDFFIALFVALALFGSPWISLLLLGTGTLFNASAALLTAVLAPPKRP